MGIQDIIDNGEKDIPVNDSFNDEINEDGDFPVIYSDTSSDTASITANISEMIDDFMPSSFDEDDFFNFFGGSPNWSNDSENSIDGSDNYSDSDNTADSSQNNFNFVIFSVDPPTSSGHDDTEKQKNLLRKIKNISAKNKSSMGKRKARRFENARQLDLLTNDSSDDVDIDDFMPFNCTFRFTQILEDTDLTNKILNPSLNSNDKDVSKRTGANKRKNSCSQKDKKITAGAAFNNLDSSEKTFFKRRNLPMGMVHYLDSCVYTFFQSDPTGTYISEPLSSYERMMLHGIAHYYRLNSFSYNVEHQDIRLTKVTNNNTYFNPPCLCLSQYLEQEIHKATNKFEHGEKRRRVRRQHYAKAC